MADTNDIPPIPLPPQGGAVPPVEPTPVVPAPVPPPAAAQPSAPQPLPPVAPPAPAVPAPASPYAAAPSPYATPQPYGQQQPYGGPQYTAYVAAPAGPAQGISIASMITGIASIVLSFVWLGFLPGVAAVILGHLAQRRQPYARPYWLAGLITGYIGVGIAVLGFFVLVIGFAVSSSYGY